MEAGLLSHKEGLDALPGKFFEKVYAK